MSKISNNLIIYNGYPLSLVVAIMAHSLVLAAVLYLQGNSKTEALELVQPTVVKALLIEENPQIRNERMQEQTRLEREREQEQEREEARIREREQERQQEEADQKAKKEAEEKEAEEKEAEEKAREQEQARVQAEADRLKKEQEEKEKADQEERDRLEQERLENERLENEQREQKEREEEQRLEQERLDREEAQRQADAADAASSEFELVQSAIGLVQQLVQEQWSRPPSARNGMRVIIRLQMLPTGEVTDVTIIESSGDAAFDRSAETAVFRAAPFSELQAIPIQLFNQNFRTLSLTFQPEDLLN